MESTHCLAAECPSGGFSRLEKVYPLGPVKTLPCYHVMVIRRHTLVPYTRLVRTKC